MRNEEGKVTKVKILVDSGNLTRCGVAISEKFRQRMGLKLATIGGRKVGTAGAGLGMTQIGVSRSFDLRIPGIRKTFHVRKAVVLKELTDEVNVGTRFLQEVQATTGRSPSLKFHANGTSLSLGDDSVELVKRMGQPDERPGGRRRGRSSDGDEPERPLKRGRKEARCQEVKRTTKGTGQQALLQGGGRRRPTSVGQRTRGFPIFASKDTQLKAHSISFVKVQGMGKGQQGTLVEDVGLDLGDKVEVITAVYGQTDSIGILNGGGTTYILKRGAQLGEASPLKIAKAGTVAETVKGVHEEDTVLGRLYEDLKLDDNELLKKHPRLLKQVKDLVRKYQDVFSSPEQAIGKTDLMEFDITLTEGARPVRSKVRPLNPKQKESLRNQLDLWEKEDVIEECESAWASAMVPALKKGGDIRWAVDYRGLNAVTVADAYPLPNIGENLDNLQGSQVYSTLDASAAYNTVPVTTRSRPLLAFVTPFGSYTFKRMPFGAKNSGATYSRFIDLLIRKLRSPYLLAYVDDVIVHTPNLDLHLKEVEKALQIHQEAGIKLNARKTHMFKLSAEYLGHKVDADGIHMQEEYVERILGWPIPKTVKQLASFLGFTGYYRSFIKEYAQLTCEMNAQKKKKVLEWTPEMNMKF